MTGKFSVTCKEQGRGKGTTTRFTTLVAAQNFVKDHWQGADYMDSPCSFHTDYSTFTLKGFALSDIGRSWWDTEYSCREFSFHSTL